MSSIITLCWSVPLLQASTAEIKKSPTWCCVLGSLWIGLLGQQVITAKQTVPEIITLRIFVEIKLYVYTKKEENYSRQGERFPDGYMFKWQQFHPKKKSDKLYQLLLTNDNSSNYQRLWNGTNHQFPDQHPLSTEVPHIYPAIPAGFRRIWHPFHHPWSWFLLCLPPVVPATNAAASILLDRGTLEKQGVEIKTDP